MERKRISSLDSLMIFTGKQANTNAYALQERQYNIFSDEYIGTLRLTEDYDSAFSGTSSEVFVETTPKYKSIKDITEIAYAYICNRSKTKPTKTTSMYIDDKGTINFLYDFERGLSGDIEQTKITPVSDVHLYFSSINNAMFNKQKYYSSHKEIESLSNVGVKYFWRQPGSKLNLYNETANEDYVAYYDNDFITYATHNIQIQETKWDEATSSYIDVFIEVNEGTEEEPDIKKVPKMITKTVLDYAISFDSVVSNKLNNLTEAFKTKHDEFLLSYYLYDLNSTVPVVTNTFTFGQNTLDVNLNYDGEFNNWFNNVIQFNVKDLTSKSLVKITPATDYYFNLAINKDNRFIGEDIFTANDKLFELKDMSETSFDGISILSPYKLQKLDFSPIAESMVGKLDLVCNYAKKINSKDTVNTNWVKEKGNQIEELVIGRNDVDCTITNILGLEYFENLKKLHLINCVNLTNNPDINSLQNVNEFDFTGSNVSVFNPYAGSFIKSVKLPDSIESIILNDITFESESSLEYNISSALTTLELNNVENLDTYDFVSTWIDKLIESNKLDTGLVNYVNINGVYWPAASYELLKNLSIIELNYFSGTINVDGIGADRAIYRKQYRDLVDRYGQEYVLLNGKEGESDLFINVVTGKNAFNVNFSIIELYDETITQENEFGDYVDVTTTKERVYENYTININDTISGNSLLDLIDKTTSSFRKKSIVEFKNGNNINIGWSLELPEPLLLPTKSENLEKVEIGDVLLFNKKTLVFITKNAKNINQNFTKIGKFESIESFTELIGHKFEKEFFYTLTCMEDEIHVPTISDEDKEHGYIEIEYGPGNYIEVEYGLGNYIEVEYTKSEN